MWSSCFTYGGGDCIVCQRACTTKTCRCSYSHSECMLQMRRHTSACTICGRRFRHPWFLQSRPREDEEELILLRRYEQVHRRNRLEREVCVKNILVPTMPSLSRVYPVIRRTKNVDMAVIFEDLASNSSSLNELYQRLLDDGFKSTRANELCQFMSTIHSIEFSETLTKCILRKFRRSIGANQFV
jgi:hypothetical protein